MTPKEKAEELINKFNPVSRIYPTFVEGEFVLTNDAKECALIAVNEILENFGLSFNGPKFYVSYEASKFYEDVRNEIKKL